MVVQLMLLVAAAAEESAILERLRHLHLEAVVHLMPVVVQVLVLLD
jgi:hypothetical protein